MRNSEVTKVDTEYFLTLLWEIRIILTVTSENEKLKYGRICTCAESETRICWHVILWWIDTNMYSLAIRMCSLHLLLVPYCYIIVLVVCIVYAFSALTLLVGRQEENLACKKWVFRCWCGYLSGARCRLFACGRADATAIPKPHHLI